MLRTPWISMPVVVVLVSITFLPHDGWSADEKPEESKTTSTALADGVTLQFLGINAGREAIVESKHDPFFRSLNQLDIELRLDQEAGPLSRAKQLAKLKEGFEKSVVAFTPKERTLLTKVARLVQAKAKLLCPDLIPKNWKIIKVDGSIEKGAAYTRHDAIILSKQRLDAARAGTPAALAELGRLLAHETVHVHGRLHPKLRDRRYKRLGFERVGTIRLGDDLFERKLTNPDGTVLEHAIKITLPNGKQTWAMMMTYVEPPRLLKGKSFFRQLRYALYPLEKTKAGGWQVVPGGPKLGYKPSDVRGFYEQAGRNTGYIIHPDEILAENLAQLITADWPGKKMSRSFDYKLAKELGAMKVESSDD